jgi:hypothetical protein
MTLNRLIAPSSEHAMPDWMRRTALADILGVDFDGLEEDPLYLVLDKLHPHRAAIEAALVARERNLFNLDATIYLYDPTSTYFEGQCVRNAKAKRGYSRDHRPDCKTGRGGACGQSRGLSDHPRGFCRQHARSQHARHHARSPDRARRTRGRLNHGGRPRHCV